MSARHRVRVAQLPIWLDRARLLGPGDWQLVEQDGLVVAVESELTRADAVDLEARLRGVGLGGAALELTITPPPPRAAIRAARLIEARRYRAGSAGFTRAGTRVDAEARRGLTPEVLAFELGARARALHVIDASCGAGGNAIGFARAGSNVTAIDIDARRVALARHNAALYGVAERIRFLAGDACDRVPELDADLLFIDPPWGERYDKRCVQLDAFPLLERLQPQFARFARVWLKLPPSFDPRALPGARAAAWFGAGEGDARRVKFLLLELAFTAPAAG